MLLPTQQAETTGVERKNKGAFTMTCSDCSHYDELNCFCWLHWREIGPDDSCVTSCSDDDSIEEPEEDYLSEE